MSRKEGYVAKYLRKRASHKKFVYKSQHLQCRGLSQFLKHEVSRKDEMQNMREGRKNMWDRRKYMIQNMREKVFFPLTSDWYLCTALKENCLHKSALEPCGPTIPKYNQFIPIYTPEWRVALWKGSVLPKNTSQWPTRISNLVILTYNPACWQLIHFISPFVSYI